MNLRVVVAACGLWLCSCAAAPTSTPWSSPEGTPLYVAPFSDLTPGMEVGGPLWRETQEAVWQRAPRRLLMVFHETALAVDATVVAVLDEPAVEGKRDVVVVAAIRVVDHDGRLVRDLGRLARRGRYEVADDAKETATRRRAAIAVARQTLAGGIAAAALTIP